MSRFLSGLTHALVHVPNKDDMNATGIRAIVSLCFGPHDSDAINEITYTRAVDGSSFWDAPHVHTVRNGLPVKVPVFTGDLLDKVCQAAARALERVKQEIGTPEWGTTYRVFGKPDGTTIVERIEK